VDLVGARTDGVNQTESQTIPRTRVTAGLPTVDDGSTHRIPGDSLGPSDGRLVEAFDAESRHFIKSGTTVLQSMIRCPARRAECLATRLALVATTLSAPGRVEAVANNGSDVVFCGGRAMLVGTAETLHGWWTF